MCACVINLFATISGKADMLERLAVDERLEKLAEWQVTVKLFTTSEIIAFPLANQVEKMGRRWRMGVGMKGVRGGGGVMNFRKEGRFIPCAECEINCVHSFCLHLHAFFFFSCPPSLCLSSSDRVHCDESTNLINSPPINSRTFNSHTLLQAVVEAQLKAIVSEYNLPLEEEHFKHWQLCTHERSTQHNLRVCAKYYKRIRVKRLAQLLGLTKDEAEQALAGLVSEGQVKSMHIARFGSFFLLLKGYDDYILN